MKDLSTDIYTHEEVVRALHMVEGSREVKFRYDLLNKNEQKIAELNSVVSGEVSMSAFNTIKRTARFRLGEYSPNRALNLTEIDYLTNRIQPFMLIKMPDKVVPQFVPGETIYNTWEDLDLSKTWEGLI